MHWGPADDCALPRPIPDSPLHLALAGYEHEWPADFEAFVARELIGRDGALVARLAELGEAPGVPRRERGDGAHRQRQPPGAEGQGRPAGVPEDLSLDRGRRRRDDRGPRAQGRPGGRRDRVRVVARRPRRPAPGPAQRPRGARATPPVRAEVSVDEPARVDGPPASGEPPKVEAVETPRSRELPQPAQGRPRDRRPGSPRRAGCRPARRGRRAAEAASATRWRTSGTRSGRGCLPRSSRPTTARVRGGRQPGGRAASSRACAPAATCACTRPSSRRSAGAAASPRAPTASGSSTTPRGSTRGRAARGARARRAVGRR